MNYKSSLKLQELIVPVEDNTELWVFQCIITVIIIDARVLRVKAWEMVKVRIDLFNVPCS